MLKRRNTLLVRILFSFIFIIILTMSVSIITEYFSAVNKMPDLLTEIRSKSVALQISDSYSREKNWDFLSRDYFRDTSSNRGGNSDNLLLRYIVRDGSGHTVYNSFTTLTERIDVPLREGKSSALKDGDTGENIGSLTVYISALYVDEEVEEYILSVFKDRITQSISLLVIALIIAAFLSARISKPVRQLTEGAEKIAMGRESSLLPASYSGELGRMTDAFNAMIDSLDKQKELRKTLIRNVSHDIATPLNIIRLEAKGLMDGLSIAGEGAPLIIEEVDKLKNFVNDLNWLAETDSGEFRMNKELSSLGALVGSEVSRWGNQAAAKGVRLEYILPEKVLPPVLLDRLRISEALGNFIDNSLKYCGPDGKVEVSLYSEGRYAVVSVSDDGPGLDESERLSVFDRYYRGLGAENGSVEGRGLGLSIVRQIAVSHGGKVAVTSEKGKGSTFFLYLPL
ncbi:MAG: HAMP domain-containing histidine kinase [Spirochaetales bacterium]|nr:HAMP domain-containing histidine kinase [Spirochaetales bacterium]